MTLVIGLTGGIGSGKTTVANMFAENGVPLIDMDEIAHAIVEPGSEALQAVVDQFGQEVLQNDGSLDRKQLRQLVFRNSDKRQQLEAILHPRIRQQARQELDEITAPYCIMVIPLLFESKQNDLIQRVLLVDTTMELQIQRTMLRDKSPRSDVEKIIRSQASRETKLSGADDIILNVGDESELTSQVKRLHEQYLKMSKS